MQNGRGDMVAAGAPRRLAAFLIDLAVVLTVALVGSLATGLLDLERLPTRSGNVFDYAVDLVNHSPGAVAPFLFAALALWLAADTLLTWSGGTPGRRALGLRVAAAGATRPGLVRSFVRALTRVASMAMCGAGVFWMLAQRERRGWHDLLAGTWIVR